jgi:hypothetical protein
MTEVEYKELPEGETDDNIVKPVKLANELGIRPQIVYGWIRNGSLPAYTKGGEGRYILRSEFKAWNEAKETRKAERAAKAAENAEKAKAAEAAKAEGASAPAEAAASESEGEDEFADAN